MKYIWKIFLIFLIFLQSSCTTEYKEYFYGQRNIDNKKNIWTGDFTSSGELIEFPRQGGEDFLLYAIREAKEKIFIEMYTFTKNENIFQALLDAKNRGVDVRILLEGNVYGTPSINATAYRFFQKNDFQINYTNNNRYTFTHAKFWIIDNSYFISTGNWTRSFFDKNREYIYTDNDDTTRDFLEKIFLKDFLHAGFSQLSDIPDQVVISPLNSREKIENFLQKGKKEIYIYVQSVTDKNILKILEKKDETVTIFLCTADNNGNREASGTSKLDWHFAVNPYLHAKIMISDDENIFLGSQNFTKNSLENNREMWILLKRKDIYERVKRDILAHCMW